METIVPGPAGPACVPGLLAFTPASLGRTDQKGARLRGLRPVGGGGGKQRTRRQGERGSFFRIVVCQVCSEGFGFASTIRKMRAIFILGALFGEMDTMPILQIRKLSLRRLSNLPKVTPLLSGDGQCAEFQTLLPHPHV